MSDLIERLDDCTERMGSDKWPIFGEAKAEIERLTAELREEFRSGFMAAVDEFCPDEKHISEITTLEENNWQWRKWVKETPAIAATEQEGELDNPNEELDLDTWPTEQEG